MYAARARMRVRRKAEASASGVQGHHKKMRYRYVTKGAYPVIRAWEMDVVPDPSLGMA